MKEKTIPVKREEKDLDIRQAERYIRPPVDIYEKEDSLVVVCDMPAVQKDHLNIHIDNGILTIEGKPEMKTQGEVIFNEFSLATFYRQFQINEDLDAEKVTADLKDGVLTVILPKAEKTKPRQIPVTVE